MPRLSRTLKELEIELYELGEETMLIEELDGYFAGLLVCPELILPGEWLPPVWSQEKDNQSPGFDDLAHANRVFALIMEQYNSVVVTLMERPERYRPLLPVDGRNGDVLWEIWIEGFQAAVALRPASWQRLLDADPATAAAMRGLFGLIDLARDVGAVLHPDNDAIVKAAPPTSRAGSSPCTSTGSRTTSRRRASIPERRRPRGRKRPQRPLPLRLGQEVQALLRVELNGGRGAAPERERSDIGGQPWSTGLDDTRYVSQHTLHDPGLRRQGHRAIVSRWRLSGTLAEH